jgi:hypothetical protein
MGNYQLLLFFYEGDQYNIYIYFLFFAGLGGLGLPTFPPPPVSENNVTMHRGLCPDASPFSLPPSNSLSSHPLFSLTHSLSSLAVAVATAGASLTSASSCHTTGAGLSLSLSLSSCLNHIHACYDYFLNKNMRISLIKDYEHKALIEHSKKLL